MNRLCRVLLSILALLGLIRLVLYGIYVFYSFLHPLANYHYEAMFVHHGWRVQTGQLLYPSWQTYPHVFNFFAPLYFWLVGGLGAALDSTIGELFIVGRAVSLLAAVATSLALGAFYWHRHGVAPAALATILSCGSGAMFGFSIMTRPDQLANAFGVIGLLCTFSRKRWVIGLAAVLTALAVLTKQNYGIYAVAGVLGLVVARRWVDAAWLVAVSGGCVLLVLAAVSVAWEPNLPRSMFLEGQFPWSWANEQRMLLRATRHSPDLLVLPVVGLFLLWRGGRSDPQLASAASCVYVACVSWVGKFGSDMNYLLPLDPLVGISAATLWVAAGLPDRVPRARVIVGCGVAVLALVPTTLFLGVVAQRARGQAVLWEHPTGRMAAQQYDRLFRMAGNEAVRMLTDSDLIAVRQGSRAAFLDAQDFRIMVESGRIDASHLQERLDHSQYDVLVLAADVNGPDYNQYYLRLPAEMADAVRANYVLAAQVVGFFLFVPRDQGDAGRPGEDSALPGPLEGR